MNHVYKLIAVLCLGVVASTHALAQDAAARVEARPASHPSTELYGLLVLRGVAAVADLRVLALSNCDCDLSDDDIAAVRAWLARMGVDCNGPE